ncbi:MAG: beta-ketoacyl-[acyl-carrier-protein] synthase II [Gammaproteobacteria bacterium CG11_big_fil_rev_8_21_14_0_20_46_22]|nr:MAG: beta-ketoacyl-[acyl-carrier-protein] synthase II [Gammaproteobacteria bacterium CG12_big_fil_rev_8_21_14_0_65_46_12]PIR10085.1 MAG: beta-ketoacyl-[acyl-carrier-protein] synthase II [Gammaproteobacteria bacterium CG11_big_fil_rev_8_21_14_0_20_46_22]
MKNAHPIYIHDFSVMSALGANKNDVYRRLIQNDTSGIDEYTALFSGRTTRIARVHEKLSVLPAYLSRYDCRNNRLLAAAYDRIKPSVEALIEKFGASRIAVVLGTSTSGIAAGEAAYKEKMRRGQFPEWFNYIQQEAGSCAEFLARYAKLGGIYYTISTACSSSGKAFAAAKRLLQANLCDAVIVGGADSECELTLNGFDCLGLLSDEICAPFSAQRKGITLGEGAALFIVSREPSALRLSGVGESSDGYHMTAPHPEGEGAVLAMRQALQEAKLNPEEIEYLNAHGTGTLKNDLAEACAIHRVFDEQGPWCGSTKSLTGHTLGASSAVEIALCALLLSPAFNPSKQLPAQHLKNASDPALSPIRLLTQTEPFKHGRFMCNAFAFGGSNVSLILEACG